LNSCPIRFGSAASGCCASFSPLIEHLKPHLPIAKKLFSEKLALARNLLTNGNFRFFHLMLFVLIFLHVVFLSFLWRFLILAGAIVFVCKKAKKCYRNGQSPQCLFSPFFISILAAIVFAVFGKLNFFIWPVLIGIFIGSMAI